MSKSNKTNTFLFIGLLFTLIFSCERNVEETSLQQEVFTDSTVSFSANVKPIIDTYCVECHRGNRFPDLRTIETIQTNSSIILSEVVSRRMPIGSSLSNQQIAEIRTWIENGALNN